MNSKCKLLLIIGVITASRLAVAITPQAQNKIKALEKELNQKYAIIKELNNVAKKSSKERKKFTKDGYSLTIESIEKLRKEIGEYIAQIAVFDKTYAASKTTDKEQNFDIIKNWVEQGKIGTQASIKLGNSTKEFVGISELQGPVSRIIDRLKSLTSSDALYTSEVELLSAALNSYNKQFETYESAINAQYPRVGFETKEIFVGLNNDDLIFSELKKQALKVAEQLESAKDGNGVLLTAQTSKWYQSKTVGEFIKEQVQALKEDNLNKMDKAIAKVASESAATHELSGADSPWVYADKKFFTPFLIKLQDNTTQEFTESDGGSFAYITKEKDAATKSLTDMLLINDAAKVITDYVKIDPIKILDSKEYKQALQNFAVKYAQITAKAVFYTIKLGAGDNASSKDNNKKFYNETLLKNVTKLKEEFLNFYRSHKEKLDLDKVTIKFENDIPALTDLKTIKETVEKIEKAETTEL